MNEKLNSKVYKNITVKAYSPDGVPTIWWWGGGDKCPSASKTYEWAMRPEMNPLEGYDGWYYWTFADVDNSKGISYILTSPGTGSKSEDLHTYNDECRDQYYNMAIHLKDHMELITRAKEALQTLGIEPVVSPIRGGTDGAALTYMGIPCPNLCTGGYNFHGRFEYASVQELEKCAELLILLAAA